MRFFTPWGFAALLAVPLIILMYILKQKYKEKEVPSLYLWKKALPESKAQEPWQKLRKNILMFLQIAVAAFLAFSLAGPYFMGKAQVVDYVLALDCSMSMQGTDVAESRFQAAKKAMRRLVEEAPPETSFSFVTVSDTPTLLFSGINQKQTVLQGIDGAKVSAGGVEWEQAKTILEEEQKALGGEIVLFTDDFPYVFDSDIMVEVYNNGGKNSALTSMTYTEQEGNMTVLVRAQNFASEEDKVITLFADGVAIDTQEVLLAEGQGADVIFQGVPSETKELMAKMLPNDDLATDNMIFAGISHSQKEKALLVTEGNLFLEKALGLMNQVSLYKATPANYEGAKGYGLYIFDGYLPEEMPKDGFVLAFSPGANSIFTAEEKAVSADVKAAANTGLADISDLSFQLEKTTPVSSSWGKPLLKAGDDTVAVFGEYQGQKTAVFGFDLNDSDFPLSPNFPILLYRLLDWYFPAAVIGSSQSLAGQELGISLRPQTRSAYVITPEQKRTEIAPPFPPRAFLDTDVPGMYTLVEMDEEEKENRQIFSVNPRTEGESDLTKKEEAEGQKEGEAKTVSAGKPLRNVLLFLALILLMIEWRVSCRER